MAVGDEIVAFSLGGDDSSFLYEFYFGEMSGPVPLWELGVYIPDLAYDAERDLLFASTPDGVVMLDICEDDGGNPMVCEVACLTSDEEFPLFPLGVAVGPDGTVYFTDMFTGGLWSLTLPDDLESVFETGTCVSRDN